VADLMDRGLVREDGAENSTGGRPGTRLQLSHQRLAMGVEIENWELRFAIGTMRGHIVESSRMRTPSSPEQTLRTINEQFRHYCAEYGSERLDRLGVCARGIVNSHTGVLERGNDPHWVEVRVKDVLQDGLGVPVFFENNVRAATLAEYNHASSELHSSRCLLFLVVGEGVGVGIVLDGKLYSGTHMSAGEFGQMVIADHAGPERHDRPGSLEQLVSNAALCDRYSGIDASLGTSAGRDSAARVRRICQEALNGEARATEALRQTARYLGIGIANLVWGLDPDTVVISSGLNTVWPLILPWIQEQFPESRAWPPFRNLTIRQSTLGDQGPLVGAMTLPFTNVFQTGELALTAGAY
jgi:predicted NBD/HSP70 family sugar kinase